jgi:hypothetical protein
VSGQLVAELGEHVLLPLLAGGALTPLPPIGHARALEVAAHGAFASSALDEARARRLRVARRLCAVDALPDPTSGEWLMLCVLNDLLQSSNPTLVGTFGGARPQRLLELALHTLAVAGPPRTVAEALGRHATFSRLLELVRIDTHLSFWVGRRVYRGSKPPSRMTRWRDVRRVSEREESVSLAEMAPAVAEATQRFQEVLTGLLAASPLTDLATVTRDLPAFRWTGSALSLISTSQGRALVTRALDGLPAQAAVRRNLAELPEPVKRGVTAEATRAATAVAELLDELERRRRDFSASGAGGERVRAGG